MARWVLAGAVALLSSIAHADTCPVPEGGSAKLASMEPSQRVAFLERTFHEQAKYAERWKWAWFGIGTATFLGSLGQAIGWAVFTDSSNPKREPNVVDNSIVAGFSVVGPVASLALSLSVEKDAPAVDQLLKETGGGTAGTCLVLARMEELMKRDGDEESFNTAWFQHVIAIVGVGALFSILAVEAATASDPIVRDEHWQNAISNSVAGLILTELQLLTTPTGAASGYKRYLKGDIPAKTAFSVVPYGTGLALRVDF
jgi:hypothetical protein